MQGQANKCNAPRKKKDFATHTWKEQEMQLILGTTRKKKRAAEVVC